MKLTRVSLFYLASYLAVGGVGLLFWPDQFTKLLFTNTLYEQVPMRIAGMFCVLLTIVVIQIIRHRVDVLYPTTIIARLTGLVILAYLYIATKNPLFISLMVIVGVGFTLTSAALLREKSGMRQ